MKREIISIAALVLILCAAQVAKATPVTIPYEFVQDESIVALSGYVPRIYSIEGQFVLDVDFDAGIASFYQVNATLSDEVPYWETYGQPLPSWTNNLDVLFELTELESVYVSDTKIDFYFDRNLPMFPDSNIRLSVTFMSDSLNMTGYFSAPVCDGPAYHLNAVAVPEPTTILILCAGMLFVKKVSN